MFDVDTYAGRSVLEKMNHLSAGTKVFKAREGEQERDNESNE
jgi:hypothetical protein